MSYIITALVSFLFGAVYGGVTFYVLTKEEKPDD